MFYNNVPRSIWPPGCFRVTGWHLDKHITGLLRESDRLRALYQLVPGAETLPGDTIRILVLGAIEAKDIYAATAHLEPLYDAFESFGVTVAEFETQFLSPATTSQKQRRICCCLGYLLAKGRNRRDPVGRTYQVVQADLQHFQSLWARAQALQDRHS